MRIGNDRASIALVTLENNEDSNESKGGPRRALARLYDSKAVFGSRADSRPKPDALRKPARGRARYGASQSEIKRCRKDTLAAMIAFGWHSGRSARIFVSGTARDRGRSARLSQTSADPLESPADPLESPADPLESRAQNSDSSGSDGSSSSGERQSHGPPTGHGASCTT
jgi:hypothetical protein